MIKMLEVNALVLTNGGTIVTGEDFMTFGTVERILTPHQDTNCYQVLYYGNRVSWIDEQHVVTAIMDNQAKEHDRY